MQAGPASTACKADPEAPILEPRADRDLCSSENYRLAKNRPFAWEYFKVNDRWCSVMKNLRERRATDNFGNLTNSAAAIAVAEYLRYSEAPMFLCGTADYGSCLTLIDCPIARPGGDPATADILNSHVILAQVSQKTFL
jgi:hypothetical protein